MPVAPSAIRRGGDAFTCESLNPFVNPRVRPADCRVSGHSTKSPRVTRALKEGAADLVAFGVPCIANPDLVERYRKVTLLDDADPSMCYGGDAAGYTDDPAPPQQCLVQAPAN